MNFLNYLHYPFIILAVFSGFWASYSDIREGKIKNYLIIFGVLAALFFYLAEILILLSFEISPRWHYFRDVLVNAGLAFLAGFILWRLNVWSAGDAKLFALFAFLIPLAYYEKNYLSLFPSFALMLNIFVVVLSFIFLKMIFDVLLSAVVFLKKQKKVPKDFEEIVLAAGNFAKTEESGLRAGDGKIGAGDESKEATVQNDENQHKKRLSRVVKILKDFLFLPVFSFGIFIVLSVIFKSFQAWGALGELAFLDQPVFLFLSLFMFFQALNKMNRFFKIILAFLFLSYVAVGLLFWPDIIIGAFFKAFQLQSLYFIFGFLILNKLIDFYIEKKDVLRISLDKLKPGMVIGQKSLEKLREIQSDLEIDSDGLTTEDLAVIKDIGEKNPQLRFVEIYKTIPLAPFIFLGVLLTLILKGTLLSLIL